MNIIKKQSRWTAKKEKKSSLYFSTQCLHVPAILYDSTKYKQGILRETFQEKSVEQSVAFLTAPEVSIPFKAQDIAQEIKKMNIVALMNLLFR